jgi:ATP-dependent helicase/DNAse subunit B
VALELVTGPAGGGKTGYLLERYCSMLEQEPILVVPTQRLRDLQQRRLAKRGAIFGQRVMTLDELFELVAYQTGLSTERVLTQTQRQLILRTVCDATDVEALSASAKREGFTAGLGRFFGELERAMITPETFAETASTWAAQTRRGNYVCELSRLYAAYHRYLGALNALDADLVKWRAATALDQHPSSWQRQPLVIDGFDELSPVAISVIEAVACRADVLICLDYEHERSASSALEPLTERLGGLQAHKTKLARADRARGALDHLESELFSDSPRRAQSEGAIRCLLAGGQRCEIELVGAKVLELLRSGVQCEKIAVCFRNPQAYAQLVGQVFTAYGIPFAMRESCRLARTSLGRGLLALNRLAIGRGRCEDLISYLRVTDSPDAVDCLEREIRAQAVRAVGEARRRWEVNNRRLYELDRLLACKGGAEFIDELDAILRRLFVAYRAPALRPGADEDVCAFKTVQQILAELRDDVVVAGITAQGVYATLCAASTTIGPSPGVGRVRVGGCEEVSCERFDAVFVCGLQEGEFPRRPSPPACIPEGDRQALASISEGLAPLVDGSWLERERHLFYRCISRADNLVVLSSCVSDEEGNPKPRSFFLDSVEELFSDELSKTTRWLAEVTWDPHIAPTPTEFDRGQALLRPRSHEQPPQGLSNPKVLAELKSRTTFSASALETFADCPVRWLVEHMLEPAQIVPDPGHLARGRHAHRLLNEIYQQLQQNGARSVTEANLPDAEAALEKALSESLDASRGDGALAGDLLGTTRLKQDLLEHLRREASDNSAFEPTELELGFGGHFDRLPAVSLDGEQLYLRGKVDRMDVKDGCAVVRDYKSAGGATGVARWEQDNRLQIRLYLLAVAELFGLEPAGGLYVPLSGQDRRPRGALLADASDDLGQGFVKTDWVTRGELADKLEAAREDATALAERVRAGTVYPRPDSCPGGRCAYPSICRQEQAG